MVAEAEDVGADQESTDVAMAGESPTLAAHNLPPAPVQPAPEPPTENRFEVRPSWIEEPIMSAPKIPPIQQKKTIVGGALGSADETPPSLRSAMKTMTKQEPPPSDESPDSVAARGFPSPASEEHPAVGEDGYGSPTSGGGSPTPAAVGQLASVKSEAGSPLPAEDSATATFQKRLQRN